MRRKSCIAVSATCLLISQAAAVALFAGSSFGAPAPAALARLRNLDREVGHEHLVQSNRAKVQGPVYFVAPDVDITEIEGPARTRVLGTRQEVEDFLSSSRPGAPVVEADFVNGRFETGDFTSWTTSSFEGIPTPGCGASSATVHAFITSPGLLPLTNNDPALNATFEGAHSARLGDDTPWGNSGPKCSSISQSLVVDATNHYLTFTYAVMAANPGTSHTPQDSPYFDLLVEEVSPSPGMIYHVNDNTSTAAGNCVVWCTGATDPASGDPVVYRRWRTIALDLAGRAGHTVKFTLLASDCTPSAHFCSVFLDNIEMAPFPPRKSLKFFFAGTSATATGSFVFNIVSRNAACGSFLFSRTQGYDAVSGPPLPTTATEIRDAVASGLAGQLPSSNYSVTPYSEQGVPAIDIETDQSVDLCVNGVRIVGYGVINGVTQNGITVSGFSKKKVPGLTTWPAMMLSTLLLGGGVLILMRRGGAVGPTLG